MSIDSQSTGFRYFTKINWKISEKVQVTWICNKNDDGLKWHNIFKKHRIIHLSMSKPLVGFGCQMTPVLLIWAQETGGTVCIEMLSGCL